MKKRVLSIVCIIILLSNFIGCFNYHEINKITFVTSIIFDRDQYGNVIIYLDCVNPYRNTNESSDKGKRMVLEGKGKTALEAMRDVDTESSNILNFTQVRAYIFTEEAATKGIDKYVNLIDNNQELGYKTYMFVYSGDVKSLLSVKNNDEEYLGLYLDTLVEGNKRSAEVIYSNVNDYLTSSEGKPNIGIMSSISLKQDIMDEKILLDGGVVMVDNHMIKKIPKEETVSYDLLQRKVTEGTFQVANPNEIDKFITLDILESNSYDDIKIRGDRVLLTKKIMVKTSIGEVQGDLEVNNYIIDVIRNEEEFKLKTVLENFFNKYKKDNIDILKVERLVKERYPSFNNKNILEKTDIDVKVKITIEGSSLVINNK